MRASRGRGLVAEEKPMQQTDGRKSARARARRREREREGGGGGRWRGGLTGVQSTRMLCMQMRSDRPIG